MIVVHHLENSRSQRVLWMLEEIGVRGKVEEDIVNQMADRRPLWRKDRFEEAHRMAMRSLEVLDRNGVIDADEEPELGGVCREHGQAPSPGRVRFAGGAHGAMSTAAGIFSPVSMLA